MMTAFSKGDKYVGVICPDGKQWMVNRTDRACIVSKQSKLGLVQSMYAWEKYRTVLAAICCL